MAFADGLGKIHGKNGAIYIAATGGPKVKVSTKTEWSLNLNRDYVDATVFGDTNKTYLVGLRDVQGTYAGLLDTNGDWMLNATASDALQVYLYADDGLNTGSTKLLAYGPGLLDASITSSNTDAVKITGNFRASGNWTIFQGTPLT